MWRLDADVDINNCRLILLPFPVRNVLLPLKFYSYDVTDKYTEQKKVDNH